MNNRTRKATIWIASLIAVAGVAAWLILAISITPERKLEAASGEFSGKPVIVLLVDSLMSKPLQQAMKEGKAPALAFLAKKGEFHPEVVSAYPTMSISIDSTILTGSYADQHHVPGLIWFNEKEQQMISYGSGPHEIIVNGVKNVLQHSIIHLNQQHLSRNVQTIYEKLAQQQIPSASINGLVYRGNTPHQLHIPRLLAHVDLLPADVTTAGPELLSLGVMSQYSKQNDQYNYPWDRLGFSNQFTVNELASIIKQNKLPAFTFAYLPDADAQLHKHGPDDLQAIEHADQSLQQLLDLYGSWEAAADAAIWIVLGDSGQSLVDSNKQQALIKMNELLGQYSLWSPKKQDAQLALALNERMGYIHILDNSISYSELVDTLKQDKRIRFIAWHEHGKNIVESADFAGQLSFAPQGGYRDQYNQQWDIEGELPILDLTIDDKQQVSYGQYPDALARLHGALHAQSGSIVIIDVKPSYELHERHSYNHVGGGSHGSLHQADSLVPLIAVGASKPLEDKRLVALQSWLMTLILDQSS